MKDRSVYTSFTARPLSEPAGISEVKGAAGIEVCVLWRMMMGDSSGQICMQINDRHALTQRHTNTHTHEWDARTDTHAGAHTHA